MDLIVVIMLYGGMDLSALMITVWIYSALLSVVPLGVVRLGVVRRVTQRYSARLYSQQRCTLDRGAQRSLMVDDTFRFAM